MFSHLLSKTVHSILIHSSAMASDQSLQGCYLFVMARSKLCGEVSQKSYNLRRIVGHANLLDTLEHKPSVAGKADGNRDRNTESACSARDLLTGDEAYLPIRVSVHELDEDESKDDQQGHSHTYTSSPISFSTPIPAFERDSGSVSIFVSQYDISMPKYNSASRVIPEKFSDVSPAADRPKLYRAVAFLDR